jgi:hypothetical protein
MFYDFQNRPKEPNWAYKNLGTLAAASERERENGSGHIIQTDIILDHGEKRIIKEILK